MKIVYNASHGGFGLSDAAIHAFATRKGWKLYPETSRYGLITYWLVPESARTGLLSDDDWHTATQEQREASNARYSALVFDDQAIDRADPDLVAVVESMGDRANGEHADLKIADIPSGTRYRIEEYEGLETIMTPDDYVWQTAE